MLTKMHHLYEHVIACVDGHKQPPRWFKRAHHFGHLAYYGSTAMGFVIVHEKIVWFVFIMELAAVALGREAVRNAVIEFE